MSGRLVPVGSFATRTEAEIAQGLLESEGIDATLMADDAGGVYPFEFSGGPQLLVDEDDASAAAEVLAARADAS